MAPSSLSFCVAYLCPIGNMRCLVVILKCRPLLSLGPDAQISSHSPFLLDPQIWVWQWSNSSGHTSVPQVVSHKTSSNGEDNSSSFLLRRTHSQAFTKEILIIHFWQLMPSKWLKVLRVMKSAQFFALTFCTFVCQLTLKFYICGIMVGWIMFLQICLHTNPGILKIYYPTY